MRRPGLPLFLKRQPYQRRRAMDAARLLPVLGALLFLLPMLWSPLPGESTGRSTASDGLYLFLAWAVLIGVAAFLGPRLVSIEQRKRRSGRTPETDDAGD